MFISIAVMFGLVAATLALTKGRSVVGWFVAGLLVGPFSVVVILLPPKPKANFFFECPACCEVIRDEALLCRYCGTAFE